MESSNTKMLLKEAKEKEPNTPKREPIPIRNPHAFNKDKNKSKTSHKSSNDKKRKIVS